MLPLSNAKAIKRMHASFLHSANLSLAEAISPGKNVNATDENGATSPHYAAGKSDPQAVKLLVRNSAHVNAKDNNGQTALHCAVGLVNTFRYLVREGHLDHNVKLIDLLDVLRYAATQEDFWIVKWLVEEGHVDVNAKANDGRTPLHSAVRHRHFDVVK